MNKKNSGLNIGQMLISLFTQLWDDVFVYDAANNMKYTYCEFFAAVMHYQSRLKTLGLKKEQSICLLLPNSFELMVLYFSALVSRVKVIPIDPAKGQEEIKEILDQINADKIICEKGSHLASDRTLLLDELNRRSEKENAVSQKDLEIFDSIDFDELFLITFTSGSTGASKGVKHSFANLALSALAFGKRFNFNSKHVFYHNLPMSYMAGILNLIILPLLSQSKIVLGPRFSIGNVSLFWEIPVRFSVNVFWFIPTILSLLIKMDRGNEGVNYLQKTEVFSCVGTAPLPQSLKAAFEAKYPLTLYESYGLSETLFVSTNYPENTQKKGSVGPLLDGAVIGFGEDGEILIDVPWMFNGYTNVDTSVFFEDGFYRSGDIGEMTDDGYLKITGRKKELIIRGGVNISPKKIENFIDQLNIFEECVILGTEDGVLGEKNTCFYVSGKNQQIKNNLKDVNKKIIGTLGNDHIVDEFIMLDMIPKNSNGKTDRMRIKSDYRAQTK